MRDAICCDECGRPRLIYSMKVPKQSLLDALDNYKDDVQWQCGDPLFDAEAVADGDDEMLQKLADMFLRLRRYGVVEEQEGVEEHLVVVCVRFAGRRP